MVSTSPNPSLTCCEEVVVAQSAAVQHQPESPEQHSLMECLNGAQFHKSSSHALNSLLQALWTRFLPRLRVPGSHAPDSSIRALVSQALLQVSIQVASASGAKNRGARQPCDDTPTLQKCPSGPEQVLRARKPLAQHD